MENALISDTICIKFEIYDYYLHLTQIYNWLPIVSVSLVTGVQLAGVRTPVASSQIR